MILLKRSLNITGTLESCLIRRTPFLNSPEAYSPGGIPWQYPARTICSWTETGIRTTQGLKSLHRIRARFS